MYAYKNLLLNSDARFLPGIRLFYITKNGFPSAVLVSPDEFERRSGYKSYKLISLETSAMSMIGSFMDFSAKRASTTSCGALR